MAVFFVGAWLVSCLVRVEKYVASRSLTLKTPNQQQSNRDGKTEETNILSNKTAPSLLVLMGSMDWLTTVVGIVYFGAVEGNPFLSGLAQTNLPAFTAIKLGTAFFVGILFYQAQKTLNRTVDKKSKSFVGMRYLLIGAYLASLIFLLVAVVNNILTVAAVTA